jgi:peptide/nickel transport system substrate-binding protein
VLLPLAFVEKTSNQVKMFQLIPQLMASYSLSASNVMTIHLVSGAKFSDGEPVNATDVADSILISMVAGQSLPYIENVTAPNPTTVVVDFTPQTASINSRGMVAGGGFMPLPMSQYKQFLPAGMAQNVLAYAKLLQNPKTTATALSSPAYQKVAADQKKLQAYSPSKLIGDGPFMLTGINTSTVSEVKSPTYYGASHVHIGKLTLLNTISSSSVYPQLYSHDIDWYGAATPSSTELGSAKAASGLNEITVNNDVVENMLFNNKSYPFTLTPVRQALAYLINRNTLAETEDGGTLTYNAPDTLPDGLGPLLGGIWLTAAQRAQLNPYAYDPSKATSLLTSAGFTKTGGHWMMPNGQQFKAQVIAPATPANAALFATETASELSAFGITATASTVPVASYQPQYEKGDFQIAWATGVNANLEPVCGIANGGLGSPWNYSFGANLAITPGMPGIGFGPNFNVPGHGVIPVSQTIVSECQTTNAGPELAARAWDWAQVVNQQVPFLSFADDEAVNFYSSSRYTSWPPASSWLWQESGMFPSQALQMMIENGYISPS